MSSADRWSRIGELFEALVETPAEERRRALDALADADLRVEVGALLEAHEELLSSGGHFLERLDSTRAGALLGASDPQAEAATISRYRIVRRLGRGGMGVVYQAHDPGLGRSVALKLLPPHLSADPAAVRRLTAEARAASALDHPNIETVYEIGETDDGRIFIAMAYYEGETLRERIARGPLPVEEAVDLGVQLAEGLSAAHRRGIIHRDIKPENLLVTGDGVLKIVDFGIAKLVGDGLTSAGVTPGTAAYMSPEHTRGEAVDERTDLWSAGVVLYEMLAGTRPFGGQGEALVHAIRNDPPRPLREIRSDLPPALETVVERCLDKRPERRIESAGTLATELRGASGKPATRVAGPVMRMRSRRRWVVGAAVAILAVVALQTQAGRKVAAPAPTDAAVPGIAVLPFEVRGQDLDVWREGMVDLLSVGLDGAADLRTIDSRTVLARWKELVYGPGGADLATSLRVARAARARYAIMGSVVPVGDELRLVAEIYEIKDGHRLGQVQVEGAQEEILELVDRLAIQSLGVILERDRYLPEVDLASLTSTSLAAVKDYLGGEVHLRHGEYREAAVAYERAIGADSTFALAWFGLGQALSWLEGATNPRLPEAMRRAALDPSLPERQSLVARAISFQDATVLESVRAAVRRSPEDARLWYALGEIYFHRSEQARVGAEEAAEAFQRATELDPGFAPYWIHHINLAFFLDPDSARIGRAIEAYGRLTGAVRGHRLAHELAFGDPRTRARAQAALEEVDDEVVFTAYGDLQHPRYQGQLFSLLEVQLRQAPPHLQSAALARLARQSLWAGRVRSGLQFLDDPRIKDSPLYQYCTPYRAFARGLSVPRSWLDERFSSAVIDSSAGLWVGCIGAWAADHGRWDDYARVIQALSRLADQARSSGDSIRARQAGSIIGALQGYAEWKRGRPREALRLLDEARPRLGTYASDVALPHGWWTGQILLELGRPAEAAQYFRAQWADPLAHYELAKIYDAQGDDAKARKEYEIFIAGWSGTDPELQPLVAQARAALARVGSARRP